MRPRDPQEPGRTPSTLELFFDLVFVVAVSIASVQLHHQLSEGRIVDGLLTYAIVFFNVWWAWMNFTWFATSFDTDDWLYRALTIMQMGGVLVLAAGIQRAFEGDDYSVIVFGYVVMRLALAMQWLRASRSTGPARRATITYAIGIVGLQAFWLGSLLLPDSLFLVGIIVLTAAELSIPILAEKVGSTPWHPHHLSERYGLFAIIVLGEGLIASSNAIIEALDETDALAPLIGMSALTLTVTAALWWIYFWAPHHTAIGGLLKTLTYGYGHYVIFAAAAAFSAGVEVQIDLLTGHSELEAPWAAFAYTVPVAVFILSVWLLLLRPYGNGVVNTVVPIGGALVLVDPVIPIPFALTAVIVVFMVVVLVWQQPTFRPRRATYRLADPDSRWAMTDRRRRA